MHAPIDLPYVTGGLVLYGYQDATLIARVQSRHSMTTIDLRLQLVRGKRTIQSPACAHPMLVHRHQRARARAPEALVNPAAKAAPTLARRCCGGLGRRGRRAACVTRSSTTWVKSYMSPSVQNANGRKLTGKPLRAWSRLERSSGILRS